MGIAALVQALMTGVSSYQQASAIRTQGKIDSEAAKFNAEMARIQARDAEVRGAQEAGAVRRQAKQSAGEQNIEAAAQGLPSGQFVGETFAMSEFDVAQAKINAAREAFGFRSQAVNFQAQAKQAKIGARNAATQKLVQGGLGVASTLAATPTTLAATPTTLAAPATPTAAARSAMGKASGWMRSF